MSSPRCCYSARSISRATLRADDRITTITGIDDLEGALGLDLAVAATGLTDRFMGGDISAEEGDEGRDGDLCTVFAYRAPQREVMACDA